MLISYVCVLLVLLESISIVSGKPQLMKPPLASSDILPLNDSLPDRNPVRRATRPVADRTNKTKAERILNTSSNRGTASYGQYSEQDIIFPDSFEVIFEPIPRIDGPPKCADGTTFCEDFDAYPYHHLRDILQRQVVDKDFYFGEDELPTDIEKRIGGEEDESFICSAMDRIVFPKIGKNKNNEWKYIVNQGKEDGYIQGIRTEICRYQGRSCDLIGELPDGYKATCKQKYVYRRLMSLNDNGAPIPDTFQLPSACCCAYRRDVAFLARIGSPVTPAKVER